MVWTWVRVGIGVLLGAVTGLVELVYLIWAGIILIPAWPQPRTRRAAVQRIQAGARNLAEVERWRLAAFLRAENASDYTGARAVEYLALRWAAGLLGGVLLLLFLYGVAVCIIWARDVFVGRSTLLLVGAQVVLGVVGLFLSVQGFLGIAAIERRLARRLLGPSAREVLERRITELSTSRAGVVAAVDTERRRIERDLHDGVQQRLVALGMLLGRARRAPDSTELLAQAHEETQHILDELRDVAWRAYPAALDNLGLHEALLRVAERAGIPVRLHYELGERPPTAVETAAYFVVSEAVTNAAKHAYAQEVVVDIARTDKLTVRVRDDGVGGADPSGSGLSGLARRVAALDGEFTVDSPAGGPTVIMAELPCG
ncbi:sensor histidine kinase [Phytohabitans flavus]|uniref:sensor histidine kinase n=1 Tax=Phytohabitans flavus TaxID=1076124 RepID=UPI0018D7147A|nr:histidine kinase [Phytohabitans flavus]